MRLYVALHSPSNFENERPIHPDPPHLLSRFLEVLPFFVIILKSLGEVLLTLIFSFQFEGQGCSGKSSKDAPVSRCRAR